MQTLYGTKSMLPIRGVPEDFLSSLDTENANVVTTLFSDVAEISTEAILFHPDFVPIVRSQSIESPRKLTSQQFHVDSTLMFKPKTAQNLTEQPSGMILNAATSTSARLTYYGGPVTANVKVITIWWAPGVAFASKLEKFYAAVTKSPWMRIMSEYSTSTTTIGMGSWLRSFNYSSAPKTGSGSHGALSDSDIQSKLISLINAKSVPSPDANTYYVIHFAPGITINHNGGFSCESGGFCAYHGTLNNPTSNNATVPYIYYGVIPDCASKCGSSSSFNNLCLVSSHELAEVITDPAAGQATSFASPLAWYGGKNGEIGDICFDNEGKTVGSDGVTYYVQAQWSNKAGACITNAYDLKPTVAPIPKKPTRHPSKKPSKSRPTRKPSPRRKTTNIYPMRPTAKPISNKPVRRPSKKPSITKPVASKANK